MKEQNRDQEKNKTKKKNTLNVSVFSSFCIDLKHLKPYIGHWPTAAYGVHSAYFETRQKNVNHKKYIT